MPSVPVPTLTRSQLSDAARERWNSLRASRPDLGPALDLQEHLLGTVMELTATLERGRLPRLSLPPKYLAAKLGRGVPALAGEPVPLPIPPLKAAFLELSGHLAATAVGGPAGEIRDAVASGRLDAASLLGACFGRDQESLKGAAHQLQLVPDLLWLASELSVAPFAVAVRLMLTGSLAEGDPFGLALDGWNHGYCAVCGSWPALAEVAHSHRVLRCALCAAGWELNSYCCIFCGDAGEGFVTVAPDSTRFDRRLELCQSCGGYLKTVDVPELSPFPILTIADMESMDMDMAAIAHKYARPPLKNFKR